MVTTEHREHVAPCYGIFKHLLNVFSNVCCSAWLNAVLFSQMDWNEIINLDQVVVQNVFEFFWLLGGHLQMSLRRNTTTTEILHTSV